MFSEDESGPRFQPTYKFQIGTNLHDRKRSPAWTDRILYYLNDSKLGKSNDNKIISSNYVSFNGENFYCSDHRPVSSDFTTSVKSFMTPNVIKPNSPIRFFPTDTKPEWTINDDNVRTLNITYEILDDFPAVNSWDWIGIYKSNFASINEYSCFTWASKYPRKSCIKSCSIRGTHFQKRCTYILLYISVDFSILGLSNSFQID